MARARSQKKSFINIGGLRNRLNSISKKVKPLYTKGVVFVKKRPMASFFIVLGVLFLLIVANSLLTPKPKSTAESNLIKDVQVYKIGSAPRATFSAKVDKEGVIQIVAQTPGIVSNINVTEGDTVYRGTNLISLANNYVGGNALTVTRQLAQLQYDNVVATFDQQKELIGKQREVANKADENADDLRAITDKSISDTNDIINLNNDVIAGLQASLDQATANNDQAGIASIRPLLIQAKSANLQLNQASRSAQFQSSADNPPASLSDLGREIALKQLDIQEKALNLSKEVSKLQLTLAQISESTMYPASPCEGTVEKVHVTYGQSVNPGTVLITISGTKRNAVATVAIPHDTATKVSSLEESTLYIGNKTYKVMPDYVSKEATNGVLSSVKYTVPEEAYDKVTDGSYIRVDIPIGYADTISAVPYLPIDIIYQTQDGAFAYVLSGGKVKSKKITLGDVVGSNVAITSGLANRDQVILDRNVIEGEGVRVNNQ